MNSRVNNENCIKKGGGFGWKFGLLFAIQPLSQPYKNNLAFYRYVQVNTKYYRNKCQPSFAINTWDTNAVMQVQNG
jgi:hypothetical protein